MSVGNSLTTVLTSNGRLSRVLVGGGDFIYHQFGSLSLACCGNALHVFLYLYMPGFKVFLRFFLMAVPLESKFYFQFHFYYDFNFMLISFLILLFWQPRLIYIDCNQLDVNLATIVFWDVPTFDKCASR